MNIRTLCVGMMCALHVPQLLSHLFATCSHLSYPCSGPGCLCSLPLCPCLPPLLHLLPVQPCIHQTSALLLQAAAVHVGPYSASQTQVSLLRPRHRCSHSIRCKQQWHHLPWVVALSAATFLCLSSLVALGRLARRTAAP